MHWHRGEESGLWRSTITTDGGERGGISSKRGCSARKVFVKCPAA